MSDWLLAAEGNGFTPPGPSDFEPPPFFTVAGFEVNKPIVVVVLATLVVAAFFYLAARRAERATAAGGNGGLVPGKLQFAGEQAYGFVRNGIGLGWSLLSGTVDLTDTRTSSLADDPDSDWPP